MEVYSFKSLNANNRRRADFAYFRDRVVNKIETRRPSAPHWFTSGGESVTARTLPEFLCPPQISPKRVGERRTSSPTTLELPADSGRTADYLERKHSRFRFATQRDERRFHGRILPWLW
jgi:hypothetical protein